jgi:hypothetical protein
MVGAPARWHLIGTRPAARESAREREMMPKQFLHTENLNQFLKEAVLHCVFFIGAGLAQTASISSVTA